MLESLHLKNVGPAPEMKLELAPRLNLITGDNGLGKTLLLDCAWWALTRTWPRTWGGKGVIPREEGAHIDWVQQQGEHQLSTNAEYDFSDTNWKRTETPSLDYKERESRRQGTPLIIYARVDGGLSIHDPLRVGEDFRLPFGRPALGWSTVFQFREAEIWDGLDLEGDSTRHVCDGLVRDVSRWAVQPGNADFKRLATLVEQLAGHERFSLTDRVERVFADDSRDFPIVAGPAGEVPVAHAPAGLRRVLGLAYLVVWARREHQLAAKLKKREPTDSLVLLIDEVESHLHPRWQRTILPSLLGALGEDATLQVIASTHSPLVLASMEPTFDPNQDAWFDLDLTEGQQVQLHKRTYVRHGEIGNWLTSEAFDLLEPRSLEGELAVREATRLLGAPNPSLAELETVDEQLRAAGLPDIDPFWVRWAYVLEQARKSKPEGET